MADQNHPMSRTGTGPATRHLDATGAREVVYCHQCDNEWHRDEHGLTCPRCEGEITEIVSPDSDPRPYHEPPPRTPPDLGSLQDHNPWADSDISDPEEADIEEHVTHGPGGSVMFSRTIRSTNPGGGNRRRDPLSEDDPAYFMRDFQNIVGNMVGPGFRAGQPGRSGQDTLFPPGQFGGNTFMFGGNGGNGGNGPRVVGGRVTFTTGGRLRPRDPNGPQPDGPQVGDLATIIGGLFGPIGAAGSPNDRGAAGMPPGLANLFQAMMNPANARSGDAVYTQEALDQIISQLMEQHPTSNAPGPASPDAIASLPKKKIDEEMLGPEGKAECSVCMDDVHMGDEVVSLPCSHWFHEACASAWLSEHNTCPICRKGIDTQPAPPPNDQRSSQTENQSTRNERTRRFGLGRENSNTGRNEARLDSIRNASRYDPTDEASGPRRWPVVGDGTIPSTSMPDSEDFATPMPGAFSRRPSDMSDQRDSRRGNTSGSDRSSRDSRRSSQSGGNGSGNGPVSWLRDRFGGNRRPE